MYEDTARFLESRKKKWGGMTNTMQMAAHPKTGGVGAIMKALHIPFFGDLF